MVLALGFADSKVKVRKDQTVLKLPFPDKIWDTKVIPYFSRYRIQR